MLFAFIFNQDLAERAPMRWIVTGKSTVRQFSDGNQVNIESLLKRCELFFNLRASQMII